MDDEFDDEMSADAYVPASPKDLETEADKNIEEFSELLGTLSSLHDKKKSLWRQIYQNAVLDRRNAHIMFGDLYQRVHGADHQHALHGQTLAKYLERMAKSNEQLLKLAEILDEAVEEDENEITDEDAFYEKVEHRNG